MVHTRHSGDIEVVESPKFMSLDNERERGRFISKRKERTVDSSQTRRAYEDDDEYNIFEDKVLDSRLRPRTGPTRAYNYLDADSSEEDQSRRHKRHSPHMEMRRSGSVKEERLEGYQRSTRRMSSTRQSIETDVNEENYQIRSLRRSRQSLRSQSYGKHAQQSEQLINDQKNDEDSENEEQKDHDSDFEEAKEDTDNEDQNDDFSDMYSRVKRKRLRIKRNVYDDDEQNQNNNQRDDTDDEEDTAIRSSRRTLRNKQPQIVKSYSLREHKPRTVLYKAPVEEPKIRKNTNNIFEVTPTKKTGSQPYQSPAQRKKPKKRSAMNSSSSSTSSSSSESDDEKSFKKRKAKSMAKARSRMMPMNFSNSNKASSVIKDRIKSGASLADVEPMNIDKNINFDSIGGLGKHIRALKEMVVFPLLYDKVFQRFNVDPPRGVLFYGPPGTGKTLVARALANECSHGDKKVAFFMRKGADCLSKWVGESERQLRLLFDQAYKYRPSIIFFDEIDGLAPVRSSRQDQIHSSIVSTLLALMDGLDSRGEIVVIGATNRIDSLDPALRRPGRFDREFLFPLPSLEARKQILKIQTASWNPRLNDGFVTELAEKCVGYCGADIKALCTEAAMLALRRRYPQIYISNEALQLDESSISVCAKDFFNAVSNIIPTSRRSVNTPGRPLSLQVLPLLERQLNKAIAQICDSFPPCLMATSSLDAAATSSQAQTLADAGMVWEELASDEEEDSPSIYINPSCKSSKSQARKSLEGPGCSKQLDTFLNFTSYSTHQPTTFRPRIMLTGNPGQGQTSYIAPAVIHKMEDLPVHVLDLPALYAVTAKTPEESCANVFHEAKRKCPSIIYMPYINQWWNVLGDTLRTTLLTLIQDLNPSTPLLLLATSEQPYFSLDSELQSLFSEMSGEVMKVSNPNTEERRNFFKELICKHSCKPPPQKKQAGKLIELLNQNKKIEFMPHNLCQLRKSCKSLRMKNFTKVMERSQKCQYIKLSSSTKRVSSPIKGSTHKMRLRSSRTIQGCNNNNHATNNGIITTYHHGSHCDRLICFSLSTRSRNVFHYNRFKLRIPKIRRLSHRTCINTNCSNNCQCSKRTQRYLHRLKQDCCSHFRVKPSAARFNVCSLKRPRKCYPYSSQDLSCGSAQMLYRRNAGKGLFHWNKNLLLPINLIQLKKGTQSRTHLRLRQRKPCKRSQFRYNLRSRKIDNTAKRMLEALPKAAPVAPKELTKQEMAALLEKEELTLMELRIFLRDVLHKLGSDKKFSIFAKAVDIENAPDYYEVIENPMDLSAMMSKIDCHEYSTVRSFVDDIDLICSNALEYNPNRGPMDRVIRHRACALKDTAYAIIKTELDKDFEKLCVEIEESRKRRGTKSSTIPNFIRTKPVTHNGQSSSQPTIPSYLSSNRPVRSIPEPEGERFSRRVRGLHIDPVPSLEAVEKNARTSHGGSPRKDDKDECSQHSQSGNTSGVIESATQENIDIDANDSIDSKRLKILESKSQTDPLHKKSRQSKCVWCKPSRRKKAYQIKAAAAMRRKMALTRQMNKLKTETPLVSQPLNIDTNVSNESDELKSPLRKSSRLVSPQMTSGGMTTRRQSLSPHSRETLDTKQPSAKTPVQDSINKHSESLNERSILNVAEESPCTAEKQQGLSKLLENTVETLKQVESQSESTKASVAKRLDLDFVVDSGAGSSLDGNGDSRDSTDNKFGEAHPISTPQQATDFNVNCNPLAQKAAKIMNENPSKLLVPTERLLVLLNKLVHATENYNVERLEKIYSQLSQVIFRHRLNYDRSDMVTELENKVSAMTRQLTTSSSPR